MRFKNGFFTEVLNSFMNFVYPKGCLHCKSSQLAAEHIFCLECSSQLDQLDLNVHCHRCGDILEIEDRHFCHNCSLHPSPFYKMAAVFSHKGPAATLSSALKVGSKPWLAKPIASFMAAVLLEADWELPDLITYVPTSFLKKTQRGYCHRKLIATELANLMQTPLVKMLKKKIDTPSQSSLDYATRKNLSPDSFILSANSAAEQKKVLLIDDFSISGATLRACGSKIVESGASAVYGLCFSKYLKHI